MSNALEAASLIMVPSGYENGTLASVKPNDGTGDFTFTRGSNLSATRINEQGYIERGYENLLLQSNSFDTTWTTSGTSVTSGQSGYDGSNDAWLLETASNGNRYIQELVSINSVQSISVYAKAGTTNFLGIQIIGTQGGYSFFNLSNGTLGSSSSVVIDKAIELVSGTTDWYRCSFVLNADNTAIRIYPTNADDNFASTTGQNIYIQDAMLNQGLVAYPYIETTTAPVAGGILENMPRLDWASGAPSLLLEPSRTNLAINEYGFSVFSGASISSADVTNPFGDNTDVLEVSYSSFGGFRLNQNVQVNVGVTYCMGHFMKFNNSEITISAAGAADATLSANGSFSFDGLGNPSKTGDVYFIKYPNGWYYVYGLTTGLLNGSTKVNWMSSAGSILICKSQYETNPNGTSITYPTSYIPTYGVSQTRLAEDVELPSLSSVFDSTGDYTILFEVERLSDVNESQFIYLRNSVFHYITLSAEQGRCEIVLYDGTSVAVATTPNNSFIPNSSIKIAVRISGNTCSSFFNGSELTFNNTSATPRNFDRYQINRNHRKHQEVYFATALSDEECIQLTTV